MGRAIDLYCYDYEKLVNKALAVCETDNRELVEKILLSGGNKVSDKYVILSQDFWEEYNCLYNVIAVFEKVFNASNAYDIFSTFKKDETDKRELLQAIDVYEIGEEIGIDMSEED